MPMTNLSEINSLRPAQLDKIKLKASEITSDSDVTIWAAYKKYDVNNNGQIADDISSLNEADLRYLGQIMGVVSDGNVGNTKQQETGNCYLLSDINSLKLTTWGSKAISDAVSEDGDGGFNVSFYNPQGEKETIHVSADEVDADTQKKYSEGDVDMRIIEMAAEKFYYNHADEEMFKFKSKEKPLDGGLAAGKTSIMYMLTGKEGHSYEAENCKRDPNVPECALSSSRSTLNGEVLQEVLSDFADNPDEMAMTCSFKKQSFLSKLFKGKSGLVPYHGYSVKGVNRDSSGKIESVVLINPWDSSQDVTVSYKEFSSLVENLCQFKQDDATND